MYNKGKFIVIDGTDGSGKATQTSLLAERLKAFGFNVEIADFPQYGKKSAGLVEEYLNGKYGSAEEFGPYRASIFYACDRYDASFQIKRWLSEGKIVISNRYVTANMGHQGGKIKNSMEKKAYFEWLNRMEYEIFGIPKPDINIILHVDAEVAQKLVDAKGNRNYIGGEKRDIHEADLKHLRDAEKVYLEIASFYPDMQLIECTRQGNIMPKEEINELILKNILFLIEPGLNLYSNFKNYNEKINNKISSNNLKIERLTHTAKIPTRSYTGDAGIDLYSDDYYSIMPNEREIIRTGIKMAIAEGYAGLVWDKSGIAKNGIHILAGVIDSGYRGEILINIINLSQDIYHISPGQKIAQMIIQKIDFPEIIEGKINDKTERGEGRHGSSGIF